MLVSAATYWLSRYHIADGLISELSRPGLDRFAGNNIHNTICGSCVLDVRTKWQKRCIVLIWMFVVGFGILPFIGVGLFTKQYPGTWCFLDFHSHKILVKIYAFLYACINIILILRMIVCNSFVVCCLAQRRFLRKQKRKRFVSTMASMTTMENEALTTSSQQQQKRRSMAVEIYNIIFLFALSLVFTICLGPFMIHILRTLIKEEADVILDIAAVRLASLNQILDPWLYILFRRKDQKKSDNNKKTTVAMFPTLVKIHMSKVSTVVLVQKMCHVVTFEIFTRTLLTI
ncbi:PE2R4-like protein [Mya arenaria]|uniref:PE2R4-like protein n=1 Tax=Mya arenaria TaxID=6604 RepID=A0ABY7FRE5_MYAAR|nr:PE2R4-like protein [Mya arenaria]